MSKRSFFVRRAIEQDGRERPYDRDADDIKVTALLAAALALAIAIILLRVAFVASSPSAWWRTSGPDVVPASVADAALSSAARSQRGEDIARERAR